MRLILILLFPMAIFVAACAARVSSGPAPLPVASSTTTSSVTWTSSVTFVATSTRPLEVAPIPVAELEGEEPSGEGEEGEDEEEVAEEAESREGVRGPPDAALRYTYALSDEELARLWKEKPEALGSISVGFADEGRLINGAQFPEGDGSAWTVVIPSKTWATEETVNYVKAAIERVKKLYPHAPSLRVNQMSGREGGYLRPHRSHQNGRDVDLAFYYPPSGPSRARAREKYIDVGLNWELVKALVLLTDVQVILVDRRIQNVLYDHALRAGEDKTWLDSLFRSGKQSIVQHARRHRDHFHVRFYNPRAQELGRRIVPFLARRPDQNILMVRVKKGDTLGSIALRKGSSIRAIQKANGMRGTFLRIGQVLKVPLRGPCTRCPLPPIVEVPPRRLPPTTVATEQGPSPTAPVVRVVATSTAA